MPDRITSLQYFKGIGPRRAEALAAEGLITPGDLLTNFPRAYINRNEVQSIKNQIAILRNNDSFDKDSSLSDFKFQSEITIVGKIITTQEHQFGKKRKMFKLKLGDGSGAEANIVFWQGVEYFKRRYQQGQTLVVSGKPDKFGYNFMDFSHPEIEIVDPEDIQLYSQGKILPKYKSSENLQKAGITMRLMRMIMETVVRQEIKYVGETMPGYIIEKNNFPNLRDAVQNLHFPRNEKILAASVRRMKFEEIFYFELFLAHRQRGVRLTERGPVMDKKSHSARKLFDALPFELTGDQKKVLREIAADIKSGSAMNRLLQGDVGSGKTIVAILAMLMAIDNGCQVALMAPTEILAEQHFHSLEKFLEDFDLNIVQLLGGQRVKARRMALEKISSGDADIIVGTHAMFQAEVEYNRLGLVVIDEQHRFGVQQRADMKELGSKSFPDENLFPHVLVMTATPIPRTLSMTVYGDLDVSIIKQLPKNRKPIKTRISYEKDIESVYSFIRSEIVKGRQAYIVYPLVEKSDKLELKAATDHYERLKEAVFPDLKIGLLHGQMFWYEKEDAMKAFLDKEYDILVATTVIEVGIDVPNASVMLIENAERFGLSQLHQLRGRVGRGHEQSYCILMTKDHFRYQVKNKAKKGDDRSASIIRLKTMEETTDGFKISEADMQLRGPGDVLGTRQSGLPEFKYLDLVNDGPLISEARKLAFEIVEDDPDLLKPENKILREEFRARFSGPNNYYDIA